MQFMSFIKSVRKQMGSQGPDKVLVQINLAFAMSGKKEKADLKDLLSRSIFKQR